MKIFWKMLPLALPFLVLVAVLSSCGKKSGVTGQMFNNPKNPSITSSGQLATGSGAHDLASLATFCQSQQIQGTLHVMKNRAHTAQCVQLMGSTEISSSSFAAGASTATNTATATSTNTAVGTAPADMVTIYPTAAGQPNVGKGWLVTSSATEDDSNAIAVYAGARPLMHVGDSQVVKEAGPITARLQGEPKGKSRVFVYQCYGLDMNPCACDADILKN